MAVHHEAEDEVTREGFERFLVRGPLYNECAAGVALTERALPAEWRGLVELDCAPFVPYGAYHQHYRLDGQLIAVAVLDVLPKVLALFGHGCSADLFLVPLVRILLLRPRLCLFGSRRALRAGRN
jgi:arginine-tRNA-protein transferase